MNRAQFINLQSTTILEGLCYSLSLMIDHVNDDIPNELSEKVSRLQKEVLSFRCAVLDYMIVRENTYIDKDEV